MTSFSPVGQMSAVYDSGIFELFDFPNRSGVMSKIPKKVDRTVNPFLSGSRYKTADSVIILPTEMLQVLGMSEIYTTREKLLNFIDSLPEDQYSVYWNNLREQVQSTNFKKVLITSAGPSAEADFKLLKLLMSGETDASKYEPLLQESCISWSISIFSNELAKLKLMYVCNPDSSALTKFLEKCVAERSLL